MSPLPNKKYCEIVAHYEDCLERHGDSHLGVDWPRKEDAEKRYQVMLEVIRKPRSNRVQLLDLGCGAAHLYEYMLRSGTEGVVYEGMDLSQKFVSLCQAKYPGL